MRKQIDFVVRVYNLGNGADGTFTAQMFNESIRTLYLDNGWEVMSAFPTPHTDPGKAGVMVALARYEEVWSPVFTGSNDTESNLTGEGLDLALSKEIKRRGRPRKVVEEVAEPVS